MCGALCDVLLGILQLPVASESANVEGARVLTTIVVPRAVSGQVGSGSGGAQCFKLSMCTYTMRASASIWIPTTHSMGARTILYGPWRTQLVLSGWRVVPKCPASNGESARHCLAVIVALLAMSSSLLLHAHLIV